MVICVPVTRHGQVDPRWGRAARVAVARVDAGSVSSWEEYDVGWDQLHDVGTEGGHHARVARFLRDHHVGVVVAHLMGAEMLHMLGEMGVQVQLEAAGDARGAAVAAGHGPA